MDNRALKIKAAWLGVFAGIFFFGMTPVLAQWEKLFYQRAEPYFLCPVKMVGTTVRLRNDAYGDGYFGASRNGGKTHGGIDLVSAVGASVFSAKSGRVTFAGENKGYGNYVELLHPGGSVTRYAHLSVVQVRAGEWVVKNQTIGASGKTGNADRSNITPHLHFEIRNKQKAVNPTGGLLDPSITIQS